MADEKALRAQLAKFLEWEEAHVGFDTAVKGIPPRLRGTVPDGWEYSAWQLVEHLRIAQADILEFCVNPRYKAKKWPDDYWPKSPAPPSGAAWAASIAAVSPGPQDVRAPGGGHEDRSARRDSARHGQTYLREILLVADHTCVSRRANRRASPPARDLEVARSARRRGRGRLDGQIVGTWTRARKKDTVVMRLGPSRSSAMPRRTPFRPPRSAISGLSRHTRDMARTWHVSAAEDLQNEAHQNGVLRGRCLLD